MLNGRFSIPKLAKLSLESIKGIGPHFATSLRSKDIETAEDLFCVIPKSYEDRTIIHQIKDLYAGQKAYVFGKIIEAYIAYFKLGLADARQFNLRTTPSAYGVHPF